MRGRLSRGVIERDFLEGLSWWPTSIFTRFASALCLGDTLETNPVMGFLIEWIEEWFHQWQRIEMSEVHEGKREQDLS